MKSIPPVFKPITKIKFNCCGLHKGSWSVPWILYLSKVKLIIFRALKVLLVKQLSSLALFSICFWLKLIIEKNASLQAVKISLLVCRSEDQIHRKEFKWKKKGKPRSMFMSHTLCKGEIPEQKLVIWNSEQGTSYSSLLLFRLMLSKSVSTEKIFYNIRCSFRGKMIYERKADDRSSKTIYQSGFRV